MVVVRGIGILTVLVLTLRSTVNPVSDGPLKECRLLLVLKQTSDMQLLHRISPVCTKRTVGSCDSLVL